MKTNIWILLGVLVGMIVGCDNDDNITPTEEPETFDGLYVLPQGNHDYDARIVALSEKYNTRIYYKFVAKDYYWTISSDIRWTLDTATKARKAGYEAEVADENYVGGQLDLLENHFFKYFSDTLLYRVMPFKVLLISKFDYVKAGSGMPTELDRTLTHAYFGYDYIGFNWGNAEVKRMTAGQVNTFKSEAVAKFLQGIVERGLIKRTTLFTSATDYNSSAITNANKYEYGILHYSYRTIAGDWEQYVNAIVSTPYEQLIAPGGILHPDIDKKQMIRKKYTYMIDHFKKEYNIDLQAIGDDVQ